MATTKKRINITVSKPLDDVLTKLSKRDQVPQATKAAELIRLGVEMEEDIYFDKVASERDIKGSKFISHKNAWK